MGMQTSVLAFILSLIIYIILGPILITLGVINELIRLLVTVHLQSKYNGRVFLVPQGADAIWTLKRRGKTRMVLVGFIADKPMKIQKVKQVLHKALVEKDSNGEKLLKKLQQILVTKWGYACWEKDNNFDVENHCRCLNDKEVYSQSEVISLLRELSEDMGEMKPQWEFIEISRFTDNDGQEKTLLIWRFQHAYMDGMSMLMMLKNHFAPDVTYYIDPLEFRIPVWKRVLYYTNAVIFGPYAFLEALANKFKSYWPVLQTNSKSERNFTWGKSYKLDRVKKVRQHLGKVSIPLILENAFISAAVELLPQDRIPKTWVIGEITAFLPYPNNQLQNRFTSFLYPVNSAEEDFARIISSKRAAFEGITGPFIPISYLTFKLLGRFPTLLHEVIFAGGNNSMFFSNTPGSVTKVKILDDVEILDILVYPPQPNDTGITLTSVSYYDTVKFSAIAESNCLTKEELDALLEKIPSVLDEWVERAELRKI